MCMSAPLRFIPPKTPVWCQLCKTDQIGYYKAINLGTKWAHSVNFKLENGLKRIW